MTFTSKVILSLIVSLFLLCTRSERSGKEWYNDLPISTTDYEMFQLVEKNYPGYRTFKVSKKNWFVLIPTDTVIDSMGRYTIGLDGTKVIEKRHNGSTSSKRARWILRSHATHRYKRGDTE